MNKVKGSLSVSIYVECPKCKEWGIDLFDVDYLNDEGQLWNVIKADRWSSDENQWKNLDMRFDCPKCKEEIIFDELEY